MLKMKQIYINSNSIFYIFPKYFFIIIFVTSSLNVNHYPCSMLAEVLKDILNELK